MKYEPMLCKKGEINDLRNADNLIFQNKLDGERVLAYIKGGVVFLYGRKRNDVTFKFPEIVEDLKSNPEYDGMVLDGEVIALNEKGQADFNLLSRRTHLKEGIKVLNDVTNLYYIIFDILETKDKPYLWLEQLKIRNYYLQKIPKSNHIGIIKSYSNFGFILNDKSCIEGIVAKRLDEPYHAGSRSIAWVKYKKFKEEDFKVIKKEVSDKGVLILTLENESRVSVPNKEVAEQIINSNYRVLIVEVSFLSKTDGNKLRFPIFKKIKEMV